MNTSEYIVKKLEELGITKFFGVPGDYNFNILYAIEKNQNVDWVGCTNELNAGYACDGYARIKGYGALVTTYGVGELSAINAVAGCMAENIPIVHIVGIPSINHINNRTLLHHNFQDADYYRFFEAYKSVTASAIILSADNAKNEIDKALKILVKEKQPIYIAIPENVAVKDIIDSEVGYDWQSNEQVLSELSDIISRMINNSVKPVIIGDILVKRFDAQDEYKYLCEQSNIPVTNFLMGKNLIDVNMENYLGTYFSSFKNPHVKSYIDESDCIIAIGTICSDINSFGYNNSQEIRNNIAIYGTYTYVNGTRYDNIKMKDIIEKITPLINKREENIEKAELGYAHKEPQNIPITSEFLYPRIQEYLSENDILFTDTGSAPHGIAQMKTPKGVNIQFQLLWGSIGWATPAMIGACACDTNSRVILVTGDGAHMVSALEIGTIIKNGYKPVIIVINNGGYTVERLLCNNPEAEFNDVINLNFSKLLRAFEGDIWATNVSTEEDFDKALKVTKIMKRLCFIDVQLDKNDAPELLNNVFSENKKKSEIKPLNPNSEDKIVLTNYAASFGYETTVHQAFKDIDKLFGGRGK